MPLWYDGYPHPSIYLSISIRTHKHKYAHARVNAKWSSQNHDTNNINISKAATRHQQQLNRLYICTFDPWHWWLRFFFDQFSHFKHHQRNTFATTPSSFFRLASERTERKMCANSHRYFVWNFQLSLLWHIRNIQWAIISTLMEKNAAEKRRQTKTKKKKNFIQRE